MMNNLIAFSSKLDNAAKAANAQAPIGAVASDWLQSLGTGKAAE